MSFPVSDLQGNIDHIQSTKFSKEVTWKQDKITCDY